VFVGTEHNLILFGQLFVAHRAVGHGWVFYSPDTL